MFARVSEDPTKYLQILSSTLKSSGIFSITRLILLQLEVDTLVTTQLQDSIDTLKQRFTITQSKWHGLLTKEEENAWAMGEIEYHFKPLIHVLLYFQGLI